MTTGGACANWYASSFDKFILTAVIQWLSPIIFFWRLKFQNVGYFSVGINIDCDTVV